MCLTRFVSLLALIVALASSATTLAQVRHDGNLWAALTRELKVSYVQGSIDGSVLGAQLAKQGISGDDRCRDEVLPGYKRSVEKLLAEVSPAQIADGMDAVFKDYRNRSLLMTDAAYVTLQAIAGMSPQNVEILLQAVRAAPK